MIDTLNIINILLPFFYLATLSAYFIDFRKENKSIHNSKRIFLFVTLIIHLLYLLMRTTEFDHPPITTKFEIFTVLSFSIACAYFILELLTDIRGTGLFIIIFSLIFQIVSSLFIQDLVEVQEVLRSRLLGLHVISALLGYAGFTISAVYGVLFFLLYKEIKLNKFGLIFERLPSLETLEKLSFYSVIIGFVLITIAIVIGVVWLPIAFPDFSYLDPKLIATGIVWLIYAVGIMTKLFANWYGKKVIVFTLTGFTLAILSMMLSNLIASSFHTFN